MSAPKHHILILNLGSSSLKFHLYHVSDGSDQSSVRSSQISLLYHGLVERIGESKGSSIKLRSNVDNQKKKEQWDERMDSHADAIDKVFEILKDKDIKDIKDSLLFIGHRVVHGGQSFHDKNSAHLINDDTVQEIEKVSELAPLHNPVNLKGIVECRKKFEETPQIAVFDTSFHHTLPPVAFTYALPKDIVDRQVRKYGFHGISHEYVSHEASKFLRERASRNSGTANEDDEELKLITLHLGNGCSACAIKGGKSIETSMGMTPLQGLVMGTRCGDIDPEFIFYTLRKHDNTVNRDTVYAIEKMLNGKSGLKGVCGVNDMRSVIEQMNSGSEDAKLAFELFCYRIKQYIGSYFVTLSGCNAIVFTAGIGENSADVRREVCKQLTCLGVELDDELNSSQDHDSSAVRDVATANSAVRILVVPTDEERQIALMGLQLLAERKDATVNS